MRRSGELCVWRTCEPYPWFAVLVDAAATSAHEVGEESRQCSEWVLCRRGMAPRTSTSRHRYATQAQPDPGGPQSQHSQTMGHMSRPTIITQGCKRSQRSEAEEYG